MDPDAALAELRDQIRHCLATGDGDTVPDGWRDDALAVMERAQELDEFLTSGGFLPTDWAPAT
jgi:hypothetical protein